jgi:hypothetical protein
MNKSKSFSLAASILLAALLTVSCSSENNDENENSSLSSGTGSSSSSGSGYGNGPDVSPQLYERKNEIYNIRNDISGTIKLMNININVGSVTNGIVNLKLPQTIPDEYLIDISEDTEGGCTVSPEDAKIIFIRFYLDIGSGKNDHYLSIENFELVAGGYNDEAIGYIYLSKAATITCVLASEPDVNNININGSAGWNKVYFRNQDFHLLGEDSYYKREISSDPNILTKTDFKWTIEAMD